MNIKLKFWEGSHVYVDIKKNAGWEYSMAEFPSAIHSIFRLYAIDNDPDLVASSLSMHECRAAAAKMGSMHSYGSGFICDLRLEGPQ
jgi:hypothetical protein